MLTDRPTRHQRRNGHQFSAASAVAGPTTTPLKTIIFPLRAAGRLVGLRLVYRDQHRRLIPRRHLGRLCSRASRPPAYFNYYGQTCRNADRGIRRHRRLRRLRRRSVDQCARHGRRPAHDRRELGLYDRGPDVHLPGHGDPDRASLAAATCTARAS